jgi:hypothetical protein
MRGLDNFEVVETNPDTGHTHVSIRALNGLEPLIDALKRRPRSSSQIDVYQAQQIVASGDSELGVLQAMGAVVSPHAVQVDTWLNSDPNSASAQFEG